MGLAKLPFSACGWRPHGRRTPWPTEAAPGDQGLARGLGVRRATVLGKRGRETRAAAGSPVDTKADCRLRAH